MRQNANPSDPGRIPPDAIRRGAVILCGGRSTRMGRDKATLPFGPETMLQRVVRLTSCVVAESSIVVVAAHDQPLPSLPPTVRVVRDQRPERGPLEGLACGLRALYDSVDAAFVSSCDAPLLEPKLIRGLFDLLGDAEAIVARDGKFIHPLCAVYRTSLATHAERLLAADRLRPLFLIEEARSHIVEIDLLRAQDPQLASFRNINGPEDYAAALRDAGLSEGASHDLFSR